jgi:hypothetical protein
LSFARKLGYTFAPESPKWLGWVLMRMTRREASNALHREQATAAIKDALTRRIIVAIGKRGSDERYIALPPPVLPGHDLVSDQLVDPPRPREVAIDIDTINDLGASHPAAFALLLMLRAEHSSRLHRAIFEIDELKLARKLGWPTPRLSSAVIYLLRSERLFRVGHQYVDKAGIGSTFSQLPEGERYKRADRKKAAAPC